MTSAQHKRHLAAGVFLAPVPVTFALFAWFGGVPLHLDAWPVWLLFYGVALFGIVTLGLPFVLYLRKHGLLA